MLKDQLWAKSRSYGAAGSRGAGTSICTIRNCTINTGRTSASVRATYSSNLSRVHLTLVFDLGPNEISVIDAAAVSQILNFGGLDKGAFYDSGRHPATPPSILSVNGEAHTAKRRVWNRAMSSAALKDYEPLLAKRTAQLISRLGDQIGNGDGATDLVEWFDFFALANFTPRCICGQ
jgi:cytochrome P450